MAHSRRAVEKGTSSDLTDLFGNVPQPLRRMHDLPLGHSLFPLHQGKQLTDHHKMVLLLLHVFWN